MAFTMRADVALPYDETVAAAREALAEQGFGVLTEIDLAATLKQKLGVEVDRQIILGACRPALAYAALEADPAVAAVLPCNVVVRERDGHACVVEILDPAMMTDLVSAEAAATLTPIVADARERLTAVLERLTGGADGAARA